MVTANERLIPEEARRQSGLLREQVERDMAETLSEFGSVAAEEKREARVFSFGYGVPMAGVRYYSFTEDER